MGPAGSDGFSHRGNSPSRASGQFPQRLKRKEVQLSPRALEARPFNGEDVTRQP